MDKISTDVLVVGAGTGGVAAAIQSARSGVQTVLATEFSWLGGMLTSAGVCAPDGNELAAWQTGLWRAYIKELQKRQSGGLDNAWVSLFTYHPAVGAKIFDNWTEELDKLQVIKTGKPLAVLKQGDRITGVTFANLTIEATITIDATELGDLLAIAEIPHRWGWELQAEFNEPSAPIEHNEITEKYTVQAPTWVFLLEEGNREQGIGNREQGGNLFKNTWENYGAEKFLNYGKLTDNLYMINWPIAGNDYGLGIDRLTQSATAADEFLLEAYNHSYKYAEYLQTELAGNYGLASNIFPHHENQILQNSEIKLDPAFALHPYYRESRRIIGKTTITEHDILPMANGSVAALPVNDQGQVNAITIGNYANDHHYPGFDFPLEPKSIKWGGRWTGTPFTIPYDALIPQSIDGLIACEKNISVSHIANGSTRLQPVVMNIGQAAGMAAKLCIEQNCQPRELPVRTLQDALLEDQFAPSAVIPLYNLSPNNPQWLHWQKYYLEHPEKYPVDGNYPHEDLDNYLVPQGNHYRGIFQLHGEQDYRFTLQEPQDIPQKSWQLITIEPQVNQQLLNLTNGIEINVVGRLNYAGNWLIIEKIL
ncbi:succinate dehydrogenase/fumarate reductase flavoprotein subunit [Xenococcus sp. PCC 7305]|uniref:FAD-dependent oxidoreductase n=1 Tax=Xenococcus sp. PCC 7305 TaxID=102125 RepID=UPI0002ACBC2B|nr:FAD-dependent oxidoreductase [Xenococcus sp. PCC 7305]ELS01375.1 succinate dehydrogenase/fumarate reductase flavoprotein subunit [Xenococcus sp. PCC 7305]